MRGAKRSLLRQLWDRTVQRLQAGERDSLLGIRGGQQGSDLAGKQALSGARWTLKKQRVPPCRSQDGGVAGMLLTAHLFEAGGWPAAESARRARASLDGLGTRVLELFAQLAEVAGSQDRDTGEELRFFDVFGGDAESGPDSLCLACGEQDATRGRPELAFEIELGDGKQRPGGCLNLAAGDEHGGGESQVERKAALGELRRDEVEQDLGLGKAELMLSKCRGKAIARFARGRIGEADEHDARQTTLDQTLDTEQQGAAAMQTRAENGMPHTWKTREAVKGDGKMALATKRLRRPPTSEAVPMSGRARRHRGGGGGRWLPRRRRAEGQEAVC